MSRIVDSEKLQIDPIGRPIPGQSLASNMSDLPYEKPPLTASVPQALEGILQGFEKPIQKENLMDILEIGLSAETIASNITMKAFSDGIITPDMAELMKPAIIIAIASMAEEENIDYVLFNDPAETSINKKEVNSLMKKISLKDDTDDNVPKLNVMNTKLISSDEIEEEKEEENIEETNMVENTGSFLDISSDTFEENEEDIDVAEEEEEEEI